MANTAVEIACSKCGAEIREGSVYCYGCGSPVAEVAAEGLAEKTALTEPAIAERPDPMADLERAHSSAVAQNPPRNRPSRRKPAKFEPKVVEVVWQEPESGSWRFVISALVVVIIGFILVGLGLYLR